MIATIAARKLLSSMPKLKLPFSMHGICDYLGVELIYKSCRGDAFDAFYIESGTSPQRRVIFTNDNNPIVRQRFSVGHEIGHIVMDHGAIGFFDGGPMRGRVSWQEIHANQFASELLMPSARLKTHGFLTPQQISEICWVSIPAATIKAEELGWLQKELW